MSANEDTPPGVTHAVVLAAGDGDRFREASGTHNKLLHPVLGQPLLLRTLEAARDAGVLRVTIVLGCEADRVRELVEAGAPNGLTFNFVINDEWRLENGVSVLAAREMAGGEPIVLLMGDHLFDPNVLRRLRTVAIEPGESVLAVDTRIDPAVAAEATKVLIEDTRITAIGKDLVHYNALDTGMFVCSPSLFAALEDARAAGDTTLSGGIRVLAARGVMRAFDIGGANWRDIDTVGDLEDAELAIGGVLEV